MRDKRAVRTDVSPESISLEIVIGPLFSKKIGIYGRSYCYMSICVKKAWFLT